MNPSEPLRLCVRLFMTSHRLLVVPAISVLIISLGIAHAQQKAKKGKAAGTPGAAAKANAANAADARNLPTGKPQEPRDPELAKFGIYEQSAPRPAATAAI